MKRIVALAIGLLALGGSTLAAGDINVTIDTLKQGQIKTQAIEFRYVRSPRDMATGQASGRRMERPPNEPIVIVKEVDKTSQFFVQAAKGELLPAVLFEFRRRASDGKTEIYQTVKLTNAVVSSVKTVSGRDRQTQEISFTFQKIEYEHKQGKTAATDSWMVKP